MPGFLDQINEIYDTLTNVQRQVADYLLDNYQTIAFHKLDELAMQIGVSTTSVIRFARSLGYRGYADMQQHMQRNIIAGNKSPLPERLSESLRNITGDKLLAESFQNDINNIYATLENLPEQSLADAVEAIAAARTVYVLGNRGAFSVSHYIAYRLSQIKPGVRLLDGVGMMFPEVINDAAEGDICLSFLTPRYSKMTASITAWLKKRGIKIILFTKLGHDEIEPYGDIILPSAMEGLSHKSSMVPLFCLCNYLVTAVALHDQEKAKESIEVIEDILTKGFFLGL